MAFPVVQEHTVQRLFPWPNVGWGLLGLALVTGAPWLVSIAVLILGVGLVSAGWARWAHARLSYARTLSFSHVFAGETTELTVSLFNAKLLPLGWVRAIDLIQEGLDVASRKLSVASMPHRLQLLHLAALRPYERVSWRYEVRCPERGIYRLGPVLLESGDLFGLYRVSWTLPVAGRLVVYPAVRALAELGFPLGDPFGGQRTRTPLLHDPLRPVGVRDYRPEDNRRQVHWKATAKTGALQVKVAEPVSAPSLMVVLNMGTFDRHWLGVDPERQEQAVAVAASIATHAHDRGYAVGLAVNGAVPDSGRPIRVPPGRERRSLLLVLEALAAVSTYVHPQIERLVAAESRRAPWGATIVVVTAVVREPLLRELWRLRRNGRRVALVSLDERQPEELSELLTYHLDPETVDRALWMRGAQGVEAGSEWPGGGVAKVEAGSERSRGGAEQPAEGGEWSRGGAATHLTERERPGGRATRSEADRQ